MRKAIIYTCVAGSISILTWASTVAYAQSEDQAEGGASEAAQSVPVEEPQTEPAEASQSDSTANPSSDNEEAQPNEESSQGNNNP